MAKRTDRQRVQGQADAIVNALENALRHACSLDMIAAGKSPVISDKLPILVTGLTYVKDLAEKFRALL